MSNFIILIAFAVACTGTSKDVPVDTDTDIVDIDTDVLHTEDPVDTAIVDDTADLGPELQDCQLINAGFTGTSPHGSATPTLRYEACIYDGRSWQSLLHFYIPDSEGYPFCGQLFYGGVVGTPEKIPFGEFDRVNSFNWRLMEEVDCSAWSLTVPNITPVRNWGVNFAETTVATQIPGFEWETWQHTAIMLQRKDAWYVVASGAVER